MGEKSGAIIGIFARRCYAENLRHWSCMAGGWVTVQSLQAGQWILPVEGLQLPVHLRVGGHQQVGSAEEIFAAHGKELGGVFPGVGVDRWLALWMLVELPVEVFVGALHDRGPVALAHVAVQGRQAVGVAVEHVQFVCQFVDHQVVAIPLAALLYAGPGEDHRALQPGFAAVLGVPFVDHAAGVAVVLGAAEIVGVEQQLVKALVPVEVGGQVQQGQLGEGRQAQAVMVVEADAG